jgi:hypothetical protein
MLDTEELGLSAALASRVQAWADLFHEHFSWERGWYGSGAREELPGTTVVHEDWTGASPRTRRR